MRILLLRPTIRNERFGLAPFFKIEPLGLEYIAAALEARGHQVAIADLRFSKPVRSILRRFRPAVVGIAASHTLDTLDALDLAEKVKQFDARITTLLGGHAVAVYPSPFFQPQVDAICFEDGEQVVPDFVDALQNKTPLRNVAGVYVRDGQAKEAKFIKGPVSPDRIDLDAVPLPSRHLLKKFQKNFFTVNRKPVYLTETARGCPYRCSFCTIWQHVDRSFRYRDIEYVVEDMKQIGEYAFIADDLWWYPKNRSMELAQELIRRGIHKSWTLVQTRADLVAKNYDLLKAWRPFSDRYDIFFGFEAPTEEGLKNFTKDQTTQDIEDAVRVCRELGYGITGNFIVDPDWEEEDFERLWEFKERLGLYRAGYTILTPLPGTSYYEEMKERIQERDWSKFDMHHILWEPRLGRKRFFELFAESWKRTVLYSKGPKPWYSYLNTIRPLQIPSFLKMFHATQRLCKPEAYMQEAFQAPYEEQLLQAELAATCPEHSSTSNAA